MHTIDLLPYNKGLALATQLDEAIRRRLRDGPSGTRRILAAYTIQGNEARPMRNYGATTAAVVLAQLYSSTHRVLLVHHSGAASRCEHQGGVGPNVNVRYAFPGVDVRGMRSDLIIVDASFRVFRVERPQWRDELEGLLNHGGVIIYLQQGDHYA
ncbi:hypothetical protein Axy21_026 [Achromobacter phage vB_AxyP_19-32_Axy21]|uniref:Uncharacterized protein n=1 Tax=Achromobacter phage vB_AxyP_19-32_Axy21 TaxID=2591045 RepID=A0A514CVR5_9CAUD|nr:hypothetical protein Axy21_026 [Achromobacter phage vB_AxyP_19-32_Axy21]